jgi:glutamyl-tRNA(Gln) amidotransferase subunit E
MEKDENIDYNKIEFKSGLEIHQQLDAGKLFCNCPGYLRADEPDFVVSRRLHAVAGEEGEIDVAVKHEASLNKEFIYQGYKNSTCLIELDEEPPRLINQNALNEALKIALLMNCEIYPVSQIMRKTVVDGSNTSGFQRTVLIGHDGFIETSFGKVRVESIALEEDSARAMLKEDNKVIYRLDRLGIPLVEITTAPEMKRPDQVKECALKIGEILRACKVKRGIGTIRQDINMSILGKQRIEIKGFQDPAMMVKTIDLEIEREKNLNEIHSKIKKIKDKPDQIKDLSEIFDKTESELIKKEMEKGGRVLGFKIPGFSGIIGKELTPGKRYGTELAYRAKKNGIPGLIHSDEDMKKYNIKEDEIKMLEKYLEMKKNDSFILIAAERVRAERALHAVRERILLQYEMPVAPEVRGALIDGNTEFMRPLPGRARMYPETDLPLLRNGRDKINELKKHLPKLRSEIKDELKKIGISDELVNLIYENMDEFRALMKVYDKDANLVAKMISMWRNEIATKLKKSNEEIYNILSEAVLEKILEKMRDREIEESDVKKIMMDIGNGKVVDEAIKIEKMSHDNLEEEINNIVKEKPGMRPNAYMGLVISKLGKDLDKRKAMEILQKICK